MANDTTPDDDTASAARAQAVVRGEGQFSTLTPRERVTAHALIDAHIKGRIHHTRLGERRTKTTPTAR